MRFWALFWSVVLALGIGVIVAVDAPKPPPKKLSNFGISGSPALGKNPPQHGWWCPDPIELSRGAIPARCNALEPQP